MPINSSVRSIMVERSRTNSRRRKRADNYHLALVIECGGMRGIAASGFIQVLSEARLLDSFDTLHGSSSGACVAANILAQQFEEGRKNFFDDICTRRAVNPWRFLSQPCMVDTDYIVDEILAKKQKLDTEKIIAEPGTLNIVTTSVADGLPVVHKNFKNKEDVLSALKATLRVPGPFECGIEIDGRRHLDGAIGAPIPIFSAIDSGATHVLIICTQRVQDYGAGNRLNFLESLILGLFYGTEVRHAYRASQRVDWRTWSGDRNSSVEIDILVRPESATHCGWFTIDRDTLRKVEEESIKAAGSYLQKSIA